MAFAIDGAVVKHLNASQEKAQLTGLSCANITFSKKKSMALYYLVRRQMSINSPVIQLCLFIKLILLSHNSRSQFSPSDAFTLKQLLTEQGGHLFAGTLPTLMAGTVRHQRYIHKPLSNADTLQSRIPVLQQILFSKEQFKKKILLFPVATDNHNPFSGLCCGLLNIWALYSLFHSFSCVWPHFHNYYSNVA